MATFQPLRTPSARCVVCEHVKPLEAFPMWPKGRSHRCSDCLATHGERERRIRSRADVTSDWCRICGRTLPVGAFRQPTTGKVLRRCADCRAALSVAVTRKGPGANSAPVVRERRLAELRRYGFVP